MNVHVRVDGSPGAMVAVALRDWLRAEDEARTRYAAFKRQLAAVHAGDATTDDYSEAKERWFASASAELAAWLTRSGWRLDKSAS